MISSSTPYKQAEIIRDTWPSLYTYKKLIEDEKNKNNADNLEKINDLL
jgi:hypothetical protein